MWVGRAANPSVVSALFGVPSLEGVDLSRLQLQVPSGRETVVCSRVGVLMRRLRRRNSCSVPTSEAPRVYIYPPDFVIDSFNVLSPLFFFLRRSRACACVFGCLERVVVHTLRCGSHHKFLAPLSRQSGRFPRGRKNTASADRAWKGSVLISAFPATSRYIG